MSVAPPRGQKRGPTVLVTDARDSRPQARPTVQRAGTRLISVDNVLQYASEIPSAQRRAQPGPGGSGNASGSSTTRPLHHNRTPSGRHPLDPKLSGRGVPVSNTLAAGSGVLHLPARSSKTSEKLVLLPETSEQEDGAPDEFDRGGDEDAAPPTDEELRRRRLRANGGRSDAERLPKSQRTAEARVTAYCTASSFRLRGTAQFVRDQHGAKTKLYDDCLYCVYQLPLLGGSEGFRVRSSPVLKNPGGRSVLDEQIEANEQRQYREGWQGESAEYSVRGNEGSGGFNSRRRRDGEDRNERGFAGGEEEVEEEEERTRMDTERMAYAQEGEILAQEHEQRRARRESSDSGGLGFPSPQAGVSADAYSVAELFIFSYGVAVLWNFTPNQERDLLADLTFSSTNAAAAPQTQRPSSSSSSNQLSPRISQKAAALANPSALPLMVRPLDEDDFETEEFHFQYDREATKPRIYNDMITLRTSDHMLKLAMSHAIGQSTKLSFFEERMQRTMTEAQHVPRRLALEGRLGMTRQEVVGLVGRLFEGRVDVNLSSNMLDVPNFFWDSEPTLHPLYNAVREYLEIRPRIQVLNERCRVFLDLAEILSDSIADVKMTRITWIIIVLIVLSIAVTCTEVFLRFGILAAGKAKEGADGLGGNSTDAAAAAAALLGRVVASSGEL